ncbi:MAG: 50S ribosomal protein L18 [Alphaproteobacteria bacterium MarineAlpha5_Bin12]|nr:50S ribosomal protein L18 [Pelagibacteraceae bacterium]MBG76295.1 50S ribosomal protein L18 [Pelagibacteraceae bacterium]PPR42097.1 MAG: 50S ribosomal protein L18 [Alphaproteobacteria bacterium MarineAlpha5_Bin12]|tara:strand:- start:5619 stop:5960 length:342 start_codon:yes stop_codon:yes gene_type:complete
MQTKEKRKLRNRIKIKKNSKRNRMSVFKSNKYIYVQIIDDNTGKTIASASSLEKEVKSEKKIKFSIEEKIGNLIAKRSIEKGVKKVVFDKGSYAYHGKVKALAESARKSGLDF